MLSSNTALHRLGRCSGLSGSVERKYFSTQEVRALSGRHRPPRSRRHGPTSWSPPRRSHRRHRSTRHHRRRPAQVLRRLRSRLDHSKSPLNLPWPSPARHPPPFQCEDLPTQQPRTTTSTASSNDSPKISTCSSHSPTSAPARAATGQHAHRYLKQRHPDRPHLSPVLVSADCLPDGRSILLPIQQVGRAESRPSSTHGRVTIRTTPHPLTTHRGYRHDEFSIAMPNGSTGNGQGIWIRYHSIPFWGKRVLFWWTDSPRAPPEHVFVSFARGVRPTTRPSSRRIRSDTTRPPRGPDRTAALS